MLGRVADLDEGEPVRAHHGGGARTLGTLEHPVQSILIEAAGTDRDSRPDKGTHHRVAEGIGAHLPHENTFRVAAPGEIEQPANCRGAGARLAEGGKIVQSGERSARRVHRVEIESLIEPQRVTPTPRIARRVPIGDPVFVTTPQRREPCIKAGGRYVHVAGDEVTRATRDAGDATSKRGPRCAVDHSAASVATRHRLPFLGGNVDVSHLAQGMHSGVCAPRHGQSWRGTVLVTAP